MADEFGYESEQDELFEVVSLVGFLPSGLVAKSGWSFVELKGPYGFELAAPYVSHSQNGKADES